MEPMKLLFVDAKKPASAKPIIDEFTRKIAAALRSAKPYGPVYRGFHACICGANSSNQNIILRNIFATNSLCVHYLAFHREEVSFEDLGRIQTCFKEEAEPTKAELHPPSKKVPPVYRKP